jgi:hypothetical protein
VVDAEDPPEILELIIAVLGALPVLYAIGVAIYNEAKKVKLKWPW